VSQPVQARARTAPGVDGKDATRGSDGRPANDLVTRAAPGDVQAWDTLVERYAPLTWLICDQRSQRSCRMSMRTLWCELMGQATESLSLGVLAAIEKQADLVLPGVFQAGV
jgi:hypothetical protein